MGRTFGYRPNGVKTGVHELAEALGSVDGKMSYPALCALNEDYEIVVRYHAFMNAKKFLKLLEAVADSPEGQTGPKNRNH